MYGREGGDGERERERGREREWRGVWTEKGQRRTKSREKARKLDFSVMI